MGWTTMTLPYGTTPRDELTREYAGDPLGCAQCAWHESAHPRVSGSEYESIYGPAENPQPPHDFRPFVPTYRVLDVAIVALSEAYLAVEEIATGHIFAGVALVRIGRGGSFGSKTMDESAGPGIDRCPARILDRLSPVADVYGPLLYADTCDRHYRCAWESSTGEHVNRHAIPDGSAANATAWRAACRARLDRPKVRPGDRVTFAHPLTFSNGDEGSTFELVKGSTFRRINEDGYRYSTLYRISRWQDNPHTIGR